MVFRIKYHDDKERILALRQQKNLYAKKPYTCDLCNVTVLTGNKWLHSNHTNIWRNRIKKKRNEISI